MMNQMKKKYMHDSGIIAHEPTMWQRGRPSSVRRVY
jgi:hypothetical protein